MKNKNSIFKKVFGTTKKYKYFFVFIISFFIFGFNVGQASAAITYVGGASATGNSANFNVSLTGLTGGSGSTAISGDMVIVIDGFVSTANLDPGVSTAGYAEVADLYASDSDDANLSANWKIMGSTPDTLVTCLGSTVATNGAACVVQVWRGVDQSTPLNATTTTAVPGNNVGSSVPNSPAITPVTLGAIVLAVGVGADAAADTAVTAPTGFGNQVHASVDVTLAVRTSIVSKAWSGSGAEDPAVWTGVTTSTAGSWVAATLALRPQINSPTITTQAVTSITETTVIGNGNVTSDGGGAITERGFVWNTSTLPTTANSKVIVAGTTGAYTGSLTGLTQNTLYYVRAYAINSAGTSYGNEVTFTTFGILFYDSDGTNQIAFNNINQNTATPIFRVSATNESTFNRFQLELNTVSNFTGTAYTQTFSGTYSSGVQYNLTASGLSPSLPTTNGITYYVRARASADGGTNYSAWTTTTKTFTYKSSGNPTWFQTTNEQFNTGTLNNVTATSGSVSTSGWYNNSWGYRKKITIDYTKVGSGTHLNFPVLFSKTDTDLISKARADGYDILFTSSDGITTLSYEREKYLSSTGELVAWIKVPSLSSSVNTEIFMYYGNSGALDQQNITGTWNSNFKGVYHFNNSLNDATSNAFNGTDTGTTNVAGKIANGRGYTANSTDKVTVTGLMGNPTTVTLSAWANLTSLSSSGSEIISLGDHLALRLGIWNTALDVVSFYYDGSAWNYTIGPDGSASGWHYIASTFDDAGNVQNSYIDGVLISGSTAFTTPISYSLGANTIIGNHGNGNSGYSFNGTLDEVRVTATARSVGWLLTEYNNQNSPSTFYNIGSEQISSSYIISPTINFNLVPSSTTWGQASWSETETNGSVSMQVYYDAGSGCNTIVPNGALAGNSTGFATSPINISGLNTTTYANICLKSTLTYSGGTPYLNDWSVSWFNVVLTLPTVTTQAVTNITETTATGNGNITATGGENNDLRGVVYHTVTHADPGNVAPASSAYTLKVEESGSFATGAFIENIIGLTGNTTYYVRAYSHNSVGYFYGNEVSFVATAGLKQISGTLTSSVFDTTANSASIGYNSIMWKGTLGGGGTGKVRFQLGASSSPSGPWSYYGGDTCQIGDWFNAPTPSIPVELKGTGINATTCRTAWNNMRYFRYKVQICSNDCTTAGAYTPIVNKIIVNWSS